MRTYFSSQHIPQIKIYAGLLKQDEGLVIYLTPQLFLKDRYEYFS